MSHEPLWIINRNGNEANDIRNDYIDLRNAVATAHGALQSVIANSLHGRNYQANQTADADQDIDRQRAHEMLTQLNEVYDYAMSGAARAIRQREGL